jgi:hypothetical protein
LRRFFLRHLPLTVATFAVLLVAAATGLYFWASSAGFEDLVRRQIIWRLETATGGKVEIATFHWSLRNLEASASGVVIHGLEAPNEASSVSGALAFCSANLVSIVPDST